MGTAHPASQGGRARRGPPAERRVEATDHLPAAPVVRMGSFPGKWSFSRSFLPPIAALVPAAMGGTGRVQIAAAGLGWIQPSLQYTRCRIMTSSASRSRPLGGFQSDATSVSSDCSRSIDLFPLFIRSRQRQTSVALGDMTIKCRGWYLQTSCDAITSCAVRRRQSINSRLNAHTKRRAITIGTRTHNA
jgi:hypothetical protein